MSPVAAATDGNALLRESAKRHPLPGTYSVPMRFRVHVRHPIGFSAAASATVYFKSPDREALVITSLPRPIAKSIARSYNNIDTVPNEWFKKYRVTSVSLVDINGEQAYQLDAVPTYQGDITHVYFQLLHRDLSAVGAQWFWRDGSSVQLTVRNQSFGKYLLPVQEDVTVDMPRFALTASGVSGAYALDAVIPDDIFGQ